MVIKILYKKTIKFDKAIETECIHDHIFRYQPNLIAINKGKRKAKENLSLWRVLTFEDTP